MRIEQDISYSIIGLTEDEKDNLRYIITSYITSCRKDSAIPLPVAEKLAKLL